MKRGMLAGAALAVLALGALGASRGRSAQPEADMGQRIADELRAVEGCLGVDLAQWTSGKRSIVAWFEDKEAALRWYNHPMHQFLLGGAGGPGEDRPMAHVPEKTPLMVIATLTPSEEPQIQGLPMAISQISIELYAPIPGGASINGRLAPEKLKVEHMRARGGKAAEPDGG